MKQFVLARCIAATLGAPALAAGAGGAAASAAAPISNEKSATLGASRILS